MTGSALVIGVGMIKFTKPGQSDPYPEMGRSAVVRALEDAGIAYNLVEQAYIGYVYGDSTAGQAALYGVGLSGIPILNVNNNCSTGSSALFLARQAVEAGVVECALALGFEQMNPGALGAMMEDRPLPLSRFLAGMKDLQPFDEATPVPAQLFGGAGQEYMERYGARQDIREDRGKGPSTCREQSFRNFHGAVVGRRDSCIEADVRPADTASVLSADVWRCRCDRLLGGLCAPPRHRSRHQDCRAVDEN